MTDRELLELLFNEFKNMRAEISDIKDDVKSIKLTLENDIEPKISDLYSQYITNSDRVSNIEIQVKKNTDKIAINEVINDIKMM